MTRVRRPPVGRARSRAPPHGPSPGHDIDRVREVITAAFGSPEDADLVDALRADACSIPVLSLVAEDEHGTVIAHALFTGAGIGDAPALTLAPVSVAPAHQGAGIGSARGLGERAVTVLVLASGWRGEPDGTARAELRCAGARAGAGRLHARRGSGAVREGGVTPGSRAHPSVSRAAGRPGQSRSRTLIE